MICPLRLINKREIVYENTKSKDTIKIVDDIECLEEQCAWWCHYFNGKENKYIKTCAIQGICEILMRKL